jgi:hypothetical protein
MNNNNTNYSLRNVFDQSRQALLNANFSPEAINRAKLTQSFLCLENQLFTGITNFTFNVNEGTFNNGAVQRPTEQRVKLQDAFYVYGMMLQLYIATSATDYAAKPKTWPNPAIFPMAVGLYEIYNGRLIVTIDNQNVIPALPTEYFLQIPFTQQTGAANSPVDMFDGTDALIVEPNLVFTGRSTNTITLTLPAGITTLDNFTYVRIFMQGVLAQNVGINA